MKPPRNKRHQATDPRFSESKTRQRYSLHSKPEHQKPALEQRLTHADSSGEGLASPQASWRDRAAEGLPRTQQASPAALRDTEGRKAGVTTQQNVFKRQRHSEDICLPSVFSLLSFPFPFSFSLGKERLGPPASIPMLKQWPQTGQKSQGKGRCASTKMSLFKPLRTCSCHRPLQTPFYI